MKSLRYSKLLLFLLSFTIVALGCTPQEPDLDLDAIVTQTMAAIETSQAATQAVAEPQPPPETVPAVPDEPPTPEIVHISQPENPPAFPGYLTDRSSIDFADEGRTIGDAFVANLYERPFTSQEMTYLGYLDINRAEITYGAPWIYVTIFLEEDPPEGIEASYGVEVDLDLDGRGDWLFSGRLPPSTEWTTHKVRAFRDTNGDVGGLTPLRVDEPDPSLDGYDELFFDQGLGPDPDAVWIRRDPENPERVQIAFKLDILGPVAEFLWGAWSDQGVDQPDWIDYNDHFTEAEAGSPDITNPEFPLKALSAVDNTCRWVYGFDPSGTEPGLCAVVLPEDTPSPNRGFRVCYNLGAQQICICADIPTCTLPLSPCTPCTLP